MKAALVIWVDIGPEDDALFNHWHSREHVQERVGCPGWLRGSRLGSVDTPGRYLLFYDAETPAAFDSEAYYARLRNPTELSRVLFPKFRNTSRTACAVERRVGDGIGAAALTVTGDESVTVPAGTFAAWTSIFDSLVVCVRGCSVYSPSLSW